MAQPSGSKSNVDYIPTDNLFAYTFLNREVNRRFDPSDDKVLFHEPVTLQDLTLARLRDDCLRVAKSLSQLVAWVPAKDDFGVPGAIVGPVVMIHLPNCCAFPVIFLGGLAAKCTMNLVSPVQSPKELAHVMSLVQPDVIFTQPGEAGEGILKKTFPLLSKDSVSPKIFTVEAAQYPTPSPPPHHLSSSNWLSLLDQDTSFRVEPMSAYEQAYRVACILWSSGTTGKSKGVMHSHRALVTSGSYWQKPSKEYSNNEVWIGLPPFYHIMGLETIMLLAPLYGAKVVVMRKFELETYLRLISKHRATYLNVAPPLALALAKTPLLDEPWCDLSSIRAVGCGAAPLGPDIIREFYRRTGIRILEGYGLSETGCFTYIPDQASPWEVVEKRIGYAGCVMDDVDVEVRDGTGKALPSGEPGEIMVRSNLQMMGYVRNPKATKEAFSKDGFVHTGDIGMINKERFVKIVDRIKDVIKYNGFQVSPVELDAVIGAMPSVLDVGTTSVYSDKHASELPIAYVVPRSAELIAAVKRGDKNSPGLKVFAEEVFNMVGEQCAYYKLLRGGIVLCDAVTKSPTGKILRRSLKHIKGIHIPYQNQPGMKAKL